MKLLAAIVLAALTVPAVAAETVTIRIVETGDREVWQFEPRDVTIDVGDSVRFVDEAPASHTASSDQADFHHAFSGERGDAYTHTFDRAGSYAYYCAPHSGWMKGTITVVGGSTTQDASQTAGAADHEEHRSPAFPPIFVAVLAAVAAWAWRRP